ncbi:hypothetical protein D3C84_1126360 [compost metagenome]
MGGLVATDIKVPSHLGNISKILGFVDVNTPHWFDGVIMCYGVVLYDIIALFVLWFGYNVISIFGILRDVLLYNWAF